MDETHLYRMIADNFRQEILAGKLKPGDKLPSVRESAMHWSCTIGTVQHAYQELARQGLITSRAGQGTRVIDRLPERINLEGPLRKAAIIHRAESFLLEALTAGYQLDEITIAVRQAMDRWRVTVQEPARAQIANTLRFTGSHDLILNWLAEHYSEIIPGIHLALAYSGSLGGLMALARGQTEIAGAHLWDEETDTYNIPFIRRLLPGRKLCVVTLAHRNLGLILPAGNPNRMNSLADLSWPGVRFVNRQPGSGVRVWLDAQLRRMGILSQDLLGYNLEKMTHLEVAQVIAEGEADVGVGLEGAAITYGLDFVSLQLERYDLVMFPEVHARRDVQGLLTWLALTDTRAWIELQGGYHADETGKVTWVD